MNICMSGGATGADQFFGLIAKEFGHDVVHYHHDPKKANREDHVILSEEQLLMADPFLKRANKTLKRSFPTNSEYANGLLRRNWYQVKDAETVYAACPIVDHVVQGGTAWAVQMFLDRTGPYDDVFIYDVLVDVWKEFDRIAKKWVIVHNPKKPRGIYAGIGSRDFLTDDAKDAIWSLYK